MSKTEKYVYSASDRYDAHFASTLRMLMEQNGTMQKQLAEFVGIRLQTLARYCSGETQPNGDKLLKIAEYYDVTVDYLLTGTVIENIPVYEMLDFSPITVANRNWSRTNILKIPPQCFPCWTVCLPKRTFCWISSGVPLARMGVQNNGKHPKTWGNLYAHRLYGL